MKITFEITRDDYWQFNKWASFNIPMFRRNLILNLIAAPILVAVIESLLKFNVLVIILSSIASVFYVYAYIQFVAKRSIKKLPADGSGLLGEHTIEINEKGFLEKTSVNEGFCSWQGVKNISSNRDYIFIFIDTHMANIIPKRAFSSNGNAEEFLKTAISYWKAN